MFISETASFSSGTRDMKAITKDISLTPARAKIEEGWQQSERGEGVSDTDAREHFRKRSAEHRRKAHESV